MDAGGAATRNDRNDQRRPNHNNHNPRQKVENGDLNWILPGKLAAFSGPAARATDYVGFRAAVPEDYADYYRRRRVTAVVRLNKKVRLGLSASSSRCRFRGAEGGGGRAGGAGGAPWFRSLSQRPANLNLNQKPNPNPNP